MAEVLVSFETPVADELGVFHARAVGRQAEDGMWEGWLEFVDEAGRVLVTPAESRQPEREHLVYWATGLTPVYLEGALRRARTPLQVRVPIAEEPASESPAPQVTVRTYVRHGPEPILNPFEVGSRSLHILRQELTALNRPRLQNIIAAFGLNPGREDLSWMSDGQLVHFIVAAVEAQLKARAGSMSS